MNGVIYNNLPLHMPVKLVHAYSTSFQKKELHNLKSTRWIILEGRKSNVLHFRHEEANKNTYNLSVINMI